MTTKGKPRGVGRQPTGIRSGEKAGEYRRFAIRLPEDVRAQLGLRELPPSVFALRVVSRVTPWEGYGAHSLFPFGMTVVSCFLKISFLASPIF